MAVAMALSVAAACGGSGITVSGEEPPRAAIRERWTLPDLPIGGDDSGVRLGGLSDLFPGGRTDDGGLLAWVITDRGPNGMVEVSGGKRRTLLAPSFNPAIVRLRLHARGEGAGNERGVTVEEVISLKGGTGKPVSGRPNGVGRDPKMYDAEGRSPVADDANGVDPEGLVVLPDGRFWVAEEYRPSLLAVDAGGAVAVRHVPLGGAMPGADMPVIESLPAIYSDREDNRGFEALAIAADARSLFVLLQSPLEVDPPSAGRQARNVRLLEFDLEAGRPAAEHVYRLDEDSKDGKLCAMASIDGGRWLVIEQHDGGGCFLYEASREGATDTLPFTTATKASRNGEAGPARHVEGIDDLEAAGIRPLAKRLVADLADVRKEMLRDVHGEGHGAKAGLKVEGMAIVGPREVLFVNDNDFGVDGRPGRASPKTCFWLVEIPSALPAHTPLTTSE